MNFGDEMDRWWGMDEDSYLDEDGKPISKDEYFKSPVEPDVPDDLPEQPQFVGDPTQFKPMPFDPNNPMMYMGSASPFYHLRGGEMTEESPFYHLRGGEMGDDGGMTLAEWNCREGIGNCVEKDGTPIDRYAGSGGSPFYHLRGGALTPAQEILEDDAIREVEYAWAHPGVFNLTATQRDQLQDFQAFGGGPAGGHLYPAWAQWKINNITPAQQQILRLSTIREGEDRPAKGEPFWGGAVLPPQDALESKKENPMVEEVIEEPMDDGDIRSYFPNAKIIRYSSLAKMSDIEQLLPTDKSYAFLLYEDSPGSGHWVVLLRYGTTIEFFCSYGSGIDAPLRWYNPKDNAMLGQGKPFLSLLLKKAGKRFKAIHNAVPFQSKKQGVATCGAWDVMRVNQLVNHNQDLQEFQDYMEQVKKETGLTYDEIVVNYVSKR